MPQFIAFKSAFQKNFAKMVKEHPTLFVTGVEKDAIWDFYLKSFPEGTNPKFNERCEYDCNTCKQFIRPYANIVGIKDNKLVSIWDIEGLEYPFNVVAEKLSAYVKSAPVSNIFVSHFAKLGNEKTHSMSAEGKAVVWNHLALVLPSTHVTTNSKSDEALQAKFRDPKNVFKRSMEELTVNSAETIMDLIDQGSLYRGDEFKPKIAQFLTFKKQYDKLNDIDKENWCWANAGNNFVAKIRNEAIGTLMIDISAGLDLDGAVRKFEKVMAPTNYKRPNTIFTTKMIEDAQAKIQELGFSDSLARRFAIESDVKINNVLFVDRDTRKKLGGNVFDELASEVTRPSKKSLEKIEEVNIEDFITNILPKTSSIELMMESRHQGNLMSLIAPQNVEAPSMLKWSNNFGWAYNGDITDSMKEHVKKAGGNVNGVLRFSIMWNDDGVHNPNDFDAHCIEPNQNHIYFSNKGVRHPSSGMLDVDIQRASPTQVAVENITWSDLRKMQTGRYKMYVHNYSHRGGRTGFTAEIEYAGQIYSYAYNKELKNGEIVIVAEFDFNPATGITFVKSLDSNLTSKEVWNIKTNTFVKVSMAMFSPNYWDDQKGIGNKHYFFIMEGCKNETQPRGFFNEFLQESLMEHKRVFEALGSKMRVEQSEGQLSGLGFSSTQRNSIVAKIDGTFKRTIKINF